MALDQSQIATPNISFSTSTNATLLLGQTFQAGISGIITKVVLYARALIGAGIDPDLIVEIRTTSAGKPTSTVLATQTILWANVPTDAGGATFDVNFSTPANVESGTTYAIVVYPSPMGTGIDAVNSFQFRGANGNPYANGEKQWTDDDITWNADTPTYDFYFQTYVLQNTIWEDINTDIRISQEEKNDINSDIRVVSTHTVLRDINSIIYIADRELDDINCDIRVLEDYDKLYDVNCDIRVKSDIDYNDINCDIRVNSSGATPNLLPDIDCDIRVLSRNLYDINCDIRVVETPLKLYDINCDIKVRGAGNIEPTPIGLEGFRVYLDGNDITDVKRDSIQYEWTMNESPASASFKIVRKSDDYNETLSAVAQAVETNLPIEIKFNGNLRWYGYVMSIDVVQGGESVIVNCLDRKQKIQEQLYDISYGRKWDAPEPGAHTVTTGDYSKTGEAIIGILDQLVTDSIISSYSGVPTGIIPEYNETQGTPAGSLLNDLLEISGNFYWTVTPSGVLEIYESASGTIKTIFLQTETKHVHLYDVLDYNLKLNDRSNLITELEVNMGTESEESRASYKLVSLSPSKLSGNGVDTIGNVEPAWDRDYDSYYNDLWGSSEDIEKYRISGILPYYNTGEEYIEAQESQKEVGRKFRISDWTDGSFIDDTFESAVIGFNNYKITGWSWGGEYLSLATPLLKIKRVISTSDGFVREYTFKTPGLIGRYYRKEDIIIASEPTIFTVTWNGIAGSGAKRKATFSQLGIRESIGWTVYEDGQLVSKSEPGYNDTLYATDRANLMLSRMNDPITNGSINLTFDSFEYYGLKLGKRVNISQTNETNIYNNNNGFPLDIQSIQFDVGSYQVSLNVNHNRNFKASVNYR